jgi:hypothetical protein
MMAFLHFARRRQRHDRAEQLSIARLAAHGEQDDVKDMLTMLSK